MISLAIDLGTTFGWALQEAVYCVDYGSIKLKAEKGHGNGSKYRGFDIWLEKQTPDVIYYEDVKNHAGVLAAHMYGGYLAVLQMFADSYNIPLIPIGVGTVKKFATGKGNASKQEMIDAAIALGYSPQDDNAADAIHILRCGLSLNKGEK